MADRLLYPRSEDVEAGYFGHGSRYNLVLFEAIDRFNLVSGQADKESARAHFSRVLDMVSEQTGKEGFLVSSSHDTYLDANYLYLNAQSGAFK